MAKTEPNHEPPPDGTKPAPTARDVITATSTIVNAIEHLPAQLQTRALIAAGTALGLQLALRGNEQARQQQQRPPQQSNGQQRGTR